LAIHGLSHLTLIVADLDRMEEIVVRVLRGRRIYESGGKEFSLSRERFYLIGDGEPKDETEGIWLAVMQGESLPTKSYNHIAFSVDDAEIDRALAVVTELGLEIKPPRPRVAGEGHSLYFYDHDNHLFELHSGSLAMRLQRYQSG
jgi:catechol 2,3-dioxygenase-like lactoylglutathione lyase family enzyme